MKIATWNVNSLKIRLPHVIDWLAENPVDALCLQETKTIDEKFPVEALREIGYHAVFPGTKNLKRCGDSGTADTAAWRGDLRHPRL